MTDAMKSISLVLTFILCSPAAFALTDDEEIHKTLNESFTQCRGDENPGFAVTVVKDGKILFSRGYGLVSFDDPSRPVTEDTLFGVASLSKSFAATLLVKLLYERTNLTVDSKVRELLGSNFKMADEFRTQETTFADLMSHRTAVPPNNKMRYDNNLTRATLIERLQLLGPSPYPFRVTYMYSNLMYGLVTRLAEIIGGQSWEDLVRDHLFKPLGMNSSTFATQVDFSRPDVATGVDKARTTKEFIRIPPEFSRKWAELAGSGSVVTSAKDMVKWLKFHLSKGQNDAGVQVMDKKHLYQVHKPRFIPSTLSSMETRKPEFPVTSSQSTYAHGFKAGFYRGFRHLTHTGSTFGYRAIMSLLPEENIGGFMALSGRDDNYNFRVPVQMYLLDVALGFKSWLNATTICSYPEPWKERKAPAKLAKLNPKVKRKRDASEYQGTYHHPAYGYLHIVLNDSLSTGLMMNYGWGSWELFTQYSRRTGKRDAFYAKGLGINEFSNINPVEFLIDPSNSSAIIKVEVAGFESKDPPVFLKNIPKKERSSKFTDAPNIVDDSTKEVVPIQQDTPKNGDKTKCDCNAGSTVKLATVSWISITVFLSHILCSHNVIVL